jgi:NAD(P)-dependent dehydrogenase (short-subunit alcohol dehydrogenase family)
MGGRFEGQVAVVTGAAKGIGAALARRLLAEGARVVGADLDSDGVASIDPPRVSAGQLTVVRGDVSSEDDCRRIAEETNKAQGRLDILVNNAGVYPAQRFEDISYAEWRRVIEINLDSAFLMTRAALPAMKKHKRGRIINIASGSVLLGTPMFTHYAAAKAGVIGFTRCLASELGEFDITVNVVSPGLTSTETVVSTLSPELLEARRMQRPLKRHLYANDIVGAILFLASEDAAFITGQLINVDGGATMY